MSSVAQLSPGVRALEAIVLLLEDAEIEATRDAGSFIPDPIGVLVGMPSWIRSTLAGRTFEIPVLVISGQPLNTIAAVDRLYTLADRIADVLGTAAYRPTSWSSSSRPEPLPALELLAIATATYFQED